MFFHVAIYDDSITEAFIWCLVKCVLRMKKTISIIIALEKRFENNNYYCWNLPLKMDLLNKNCATCRINFTLEHLAPASPAYDFFRQCLNMTYTAESTKIRFELQPISMSSILRYSDYERMKELVSQWTKIFVLGGPQKINIIVLCMVMQEIWQLIPILA